MPPDPRGHTEGREGQKGSPLQEVSCLIAVLFPLDQCATQGICTHSKIVGPQLPASPFGSENSTLQFDL